ncbi:MAG: ribosome biogenesis GTP-binding protein YihA/YsxC [Christensenellales bacterium]
MKIMSSEFLTSVANKDKILELDAKEFAFVGRSNCGKSSLINSLVNKKSLAKTSSNPGHTKLINYFWVNKNENDRFLLVDLPGYGFSKAGKATNESWSDLIGTYLLNAKNLKRVFVLVDIRHRPSNLDKLMIEFLYYNQIPFSVVATKVDKIPKSKIQQYLKIITSELKIAIGNVLTSSSIDRRGIENILERIENDIK